MTIAITPTSSPPVTWSDPRQNLCPPLPGITLHHRWLAILILTALWLGGCATVIPESSAPAASRSVGADESPARSQTLPSPAPVYGQGPLSTLETTETRFAPVEALAAPTDLWDRIRRGFAMPDLDSELVRDREQWYSSRPDYIQRMTERSSRYLFHIVEEIERRNMPMELALLPFIESAFNPQAVSSARAAGMWQFMPATGQSFDLKQNMFRDDRRDVLASTRAALDYLQQLHGRFGDWHLALAAYNWGQGNVNRAVTRNQREGLPTGYTDLAMPLETRMYVPKLQAVKNIIARPETFGTELPLIGNHPFFDTVTLERDMDVAVIARLSGISEQDFRALNPSLRHPIVMAAGTPNILLPWDSATIFLNNLQTYKGPVASWTAWVVPTTMTAAQAAKHLGMSEQELRSVNNIPRNMRLRAGSSLLVHRNEQRDQDVSGHVADNGQLRLQPETILKRVTVRARQGENLAQLARRYGVSPVSAASWNRMAVNTRLKAGQRVTLVLPRPAAIPGASSAGKREPAKTTSKQRKATTVSARQTKPKAAAKTAVRKAGAKPAKAETKIAVTAGSKQKP